MTVTVKSTSLIDDTAGSTILTLGTGDAVFVLRDAAVMQTNLGIAILLSGFGIDVFVEGTLAGGLNAITDDLASQTNNRLHIAATGFVASVASSAISLSGGGATIDNAGAIASPVQGVSFSGTGTSLVNTGTISGDQVGVQGFGAGARIDNSGTISGAAGLGLFGAGTSLVNSGTITGGYGVYVGGNDIDVTNTATGRITSSGRDPDTAAAIAITDAAAFHLHNDGLLEGVGVAALRISAKFAGLPGAASTVADVVNTGTISATQGTAILLRASGGSDQVEMHLANTGRIIGDVVLVGGNDLYDGEGGRLLGTLSAGAGNDTLVGGAGRDRLRGEAGSDSIEGGAGSDRLDGGSEDDTIDGGAGADGLAGGDGIDTLVYAGSAAGVIVDLDAGEGSGGDAAGDTLSGFERVVGSALDDEISGAVAAETLDGGAGRDLLEGQGGADLLLGRRGNDTLVGGNGADTLTGGAGADLFVYAAVAESGAGAANRDRITDFNPAEGDRISLTALDANAGLAGDQDFTFIGTAAFSGAGQLRYVPGATTLIEANVTVGDTVADFRITLVGSIALTASMFDL